METKNVTQPRYRKVEIEIPLPSIRRYKPGSGPPPPQISLLPPRDSTAYIIDQFVLPTDEDATLTSRRLIYYHVGFTDLPHVKILLPCTEVLDYVSPRELEEWEYHNWERKMKERVRKQEETKRTGRPRKKRIVEASEPQAKTANAPTLSSADDALLLSREVAGPSLSTPQKRKLSAMLEEEKTGEMSNTEESDGSAVRRQLRGDLVIEGSEETGEDLGSESMDQFALTHDDTIGATSLRANSAAPMMQRKYGSTSAAQQATFVSQGSTAELSTIPVTQVTPTNTSRQTLTPNPRPNSLSNESVPWTATPRVSQSQGNAPVLSTAKKKVRPPKLKDSLAKRRQPPSTKKKQKATDPEPEPEDDEWEVKGLLDDKWFLEDGVKVHKYLVLWEGDWPPDQNPTWEPEENIQDQALIKKYQQKKAAGLLKSSPVKRQKTLRHFLSSTPYRTVAEAFAGGIDEQPPPVIQDTDSEAKLPEEQFFVTENLGSVGPANESRPSVTKPKSGFQVFDNTLARYNRTFSR